MQYMIGDAAYMFAVGIGVAWGLEQAVYGAGLSSRSSLRAESTFAPYAPSLALVCAWAVLTSLSVAFVGLTWRSPAAVLTKSFHVAAEAAIFWQILRARALHLAASVLAVGVGCTLLVALTMPCDQTLVLATTSGFILDAGNFSTHLLLWLRGDCPTLVVAAFGMHAVYLSFYLSLFLADLGNPLGAGFRLIGMFANLLASELALEYVRRQTKTPPLVLSRSASLFACLGLIVAQSLSA